MGIGPVDESRIGDTTVNGNVVDLQAYRDSAARSNRTASPMMTSTPGQKSAAFWIIACLFVIFFLRFVLL